MARQSIGFAILPPKTTTAARANLKIRAQPYPLVMAFFYTSYEDLTHSMTHTQKKYRAPRVGAGEAFRRARAKRARARPSARPKSWTNAADASDRDDGRVRGSVRKQRRRRRRRRRLRWDRRALDRRGGRRTTRRATARTRSWDRRDRRR